ncbi:hypothetical protein J4732_18870 [Serratia marcescens]|uniref:Uncharacterized protein n=1 Tax=Serratia marcescens TaxID=615 RepID=A0A939NKM0_SERMA|nr:hypothetical protein [Serratia marcescens]
MSTHSSSPQPAVDLDKEAGAGNRPLSGVYLQLATVLAIVISAYAIYANALSNTQEFYRNTTFLSGILIPGFILFPSRPGTPPAASTAGTICSSS